MEEVKRNNQLIIDEQKKLSLTGVISIDNFNTENIYLTSNLGRMTLNGEGLKIIAFSKTTGILNAEGKFMSVKYGTKKVGFFKRIFK